MKLSLLLVYITVVSSFELPKIPRNEYIELDKIYLAKRLNWTTCEEFLENSEFDLNSVVGTNWKQFYCWHPIKEFSYLVDFEIAAPTLISRFQLELDRKLQNPPVNWTAAGLFMQTTIDFNALFMQLNRSGLFRAIPSHYFQAENFPHYSGMLFAMKMVEPGYLGIMNCKYRHAMALAPENAMPSNETAKAEASRFKYRSEDGYIPEEMPHSNLKPKIPINVTRAMEDMEDNNFEEDELLHLNIF